MSKKTIIGAFLGGAAVGAVSLLFAPKKGSELRADAQVKLAAVKEKAQATIEKYRNKEANQEAMLEENAILIEDVASENSAEIEEDIASEKPQN